MSLKRKLERSEILNKSETGFWCVKMIRKTRDIEPDKGESERRKRNWKKMNIGGIKRLVYRVPMKKTLSTLSRLIVQSSQLSIVFI